jgi:hypothetical protein
MNGRTNIQVAFITIGKSRDIYLHLILQALSKCFPINWMPNVIIVDNAQAGINVLK